MKKYRVTVSYRFSDGHLIMGDKPERYFDHKIMACLFMARIAIYSFFNLAPCAKYFTNMHKAQQ